MGNSNIVLCHAKKFSSQFIDSALYSDDIALAYVCVQAWHFAGFFLMPQRQIERVWLRSLYFQLFFLFWNDFSGFYAKMSSSFHSHINTDTHTHTQKCHYRFYRHHVEFFLPSQWIFINFYYFFFLRFVENLGNWKKRMCKLFLSSCCVYCLNDLWHCDFFCYWQYGK